MILKEEPGQRPYPAEPLLFVCLKDSQGKKKSNLSVGLGGDKRDRTAVVCLPERLSKVLDKEKTPTLRLELVEISGIGLLLFVCLKDSQ
jgi:hypothetical protein